MNQTTKNLGKTVKDKDIFEWSSSYIYTKNHSFINLFWLCQHCWPGRNQILQTFSSHLLSSLEIKHLGLSLLWTFERVLLYSFPWVGFQFKWQWAGQIGKVKWLICKTELFISGKNRRLWILGTGDVTCSYKEGIQMLVRTGGHVKDPALCCLCTTGVGIIALHRYLRCQEGKMPDCSSLWSDRTKHNKARQEKSKN